MIITNLLLQRSLYLALTEVVKKWTMPIPNWGIMLNQVTARLEDRVIT